MQQPDFNTLLASHIQLLSGCCFSGVDSGSSATQYVWSERIPDVTMNFATHVELNHLDWAIQAARRRNRAPAVLAPDEDAMKRFRRDPRFTEMFPARWMVFTAGDRLCAPPVPSIDLTTSEAPTPQREFMDVFAALFPDDNVNDHVRKYYVPMLNSARPVNGTQTFHFVAFHDRQPVACASIYVQGQFAGLYNVGTIRSHQGRGFGFAITFLAVQRAISLGCDIVFLQCPADTHIERLYERAGFRKAHSPFLMCF